MEFIRAVLRASEQIDPEVRIWWFCERCDDETNLGTWRMPVAGGPLVDDEGKARCPDCGGELSPVSDEVLAVIRGE